MKILGEIYSCKKLSTILVLYSILVWLFLQAGHRLQSNLSRYTTGLPTVHINYNRDASAVSEYDPSKLALLIEAVPLQHTTPLLLHMMKVVPPAWKFLYLGSDESIEMLEKSSAIRQQQRKGKLELRYFWPNVSAVSVEKMSLLLTNPTFYEKELPGVENLLIFTTQSILCANARLSLDDWLGYDWIGAPWHGDDSFAGTTGLSLRRVSRIMKVLSFQKRHAGDEPEDMWFSSRLGLLPGAQVASAREGAKFSVQHVWSERPMGYYLGSRGDPLPGEVWTSKDQRWAIYNYCPEIKMIVDMELEREHCYSF